MNTLQEFMTFSKGWAYFLALVLIVAFIFFWRFLTDREER
jgi:type II secretory pathway component PulF